MGGGDIACTVSGHGAGEMGKCQAVFRGVGLWPEGKGRGICTRTEERGRWRNLRGIVGVVKQVRVGGKRTRRIRAKEYGKIKNFCLCEKRKTLSTCVTSIPWLFTYTNIGCLKFSHPLKRIFILFYTIFQHS